MGHPLATEPLTTSMEPPTQPKKRLLVAVNFTDRELGLQTKGHGDPYLARPTTTPRLLFTWR